MRESEKQEMPRTLRDVYNLFKRLPLKEKFKIFMALFFGVVYYSPCDL